MFVELKSTSEEAEKPLGWSQPETYRPARVAFLWQVPASASVACSHPTVTSCQLLPSPYSLQYLNMLIISYKVPQILAQSTFLKVCGSRGLFRLKSLFNVAHTSL